MAKRCPPGVICIENITIMVVLLVIIVFSYLYFKSSVSKPTNETQTSQSSYSQPQITREIIINDGGGFSSGLFPRPNYSYSNMPNDILLNPYTAPYRDDRVFPFNLDPRGAIPIVPINISTSAVDSSYRQVGILKRVNGSEMLLPLMGRPLFTNRDKWQFYTLNENNIKLPVTFKQKSCTSEYGCDNVYTGDSVYVDGIDAVFKATMYDNAVYKYIPFI